MNKDLLIGARREIKYVGSHSNLNYVKSWLKFNCSHFRKQYPDRYVRSVYFDSPSLDSYESNVSGISKRMKLRYRWYGQDIEPIKGKLEVKRKINSLGWKEFLNVPYPKNLNSVCIKEYSEKSISNSDISFYDLYKLYSIPVATIGYKREYFVSRDGSIRATIDSEQFYINQLGNSNYSCQKQKFERDLIVLEIKCPHSHSNYLPSILEGVPLRLGKNSKYVNAVNTLLRN
jgi:SPX domain protein involved in polyphosphate accumulation